MVKKNHAFTLIELLVVISVISILLGIVVPRFKAMQDEANKAKAKAELKTLQTAIESFYINNSPSAYPETSTTVCVSDLNGQTPKIVSSILYDPFSVGEPAEYNYIRSSNGSYYVIFSIGPDGEANITGIGDDGILEGDSNEDDLFATNGSGWE